jgi:hypothetical protein
LIDRVISEYIATNPASCPELLFPGLRPGGWLRQPGSHNVGCATESFKPIRCHL